MSRAILAPRRKAALRVQRTPVALLNASHSRARARLRAVFSASLGSFALITCRSDALARSLNALGTYPCAAGFADIGGPTTMRSARIG
ncbi:MAG: hypothetical protein ABJE77_06405 [Tateyamaria sp.]